MRITPLERRALNRRMKNRFPLAKRGSLFAPQLVIVVVANLWLAPGVLAQVANNSAAAVSLVQEGQSNASSNVFSRTYTKEELGKKSPENPTPGLGQVLASQLTSVLQALTQQQGKGKLMEIYNGAAAKNKRDFALFAAAMRDDRIDSGTDGEQLRNYISNEIQSSASDRAIRSNDVLAKLKTGFNFNLDLANIFSKKKKPEQGSVHYGLIIQGITPDENAPPRAALGESVEEQMAYAGRAEVQWTIGPINEQTSRPFSNAITEASNEPEAGSIASRFKAPSGRFKAKIDPVSSDSIKAGGTAGIPGVRITATQEQGLYEVMYQTKTNFEKDKMEHQFKAPIAGELALGRRYNDSFEVIQTSAFNILVDKRAPIVNIHYMNLDDKYAAELRVTKNRHEFGANAELPSGWKSEDKLGKNNGEKYKAEYKFSF